MVFLSDADQSVLTNFPVVNSVLETYMRHVKVGDSEGWCGPHYLTLLVRAFTAGEDAVAAWARAQDDALLLDIIPLKDGRDYIILQRLYTKQTYPDAIREKNAFEAMLMGLIPKQHDTMATRQNAHS